jgi:hypothetical protein
MEAAVVALTIVLMPVGFPYFAPLGLLFLYAGNALALPRLPRDIWLILALLSAFLPFANGLKGMAQFALCLITLLAFSRIGESGLWRRLVIIPVSFAIASLVLVLIAAVSPELGTFAAIFVPDEYGGERFRLVFSEPNHLVAFLMFLMIILTAQIRTMHPVVQILALLGATLAVATAASPLGYAGLLIYLWGLSFDKPAGLRFGVMAGLAVVSFVAFQFLPDSVIARIDFVLEGQDNSTNFRTWGSFAIAATTLADLGKILTGVGLGGARAVLDGNPYMVFFAADELSVLPSFIATTLLEVGTIGLMLVAILWGRLVALAWRQPPVLNGLSFAILNCLTGSFFFDGFSWAAFGLAAGMTLRCQPSAAGRDLHATARLETA